MSNFTFYLSGGKVYKKTANGKLTFLKDEEVIELKLTALSFAISYQAENFEKKILPELLEQHRDKLINDIVQ